MTAAAADLDRQIMELPPGYYFIFVIVASTKQILRDVKLKAGERLHYLELLNRAIGGLLTPQVLAAIEPACVTQCQMLGELLKLDPPDDRFEYEPDRPINPHRYSLELLMRAETFKHFVKLNPGIRAALALVETRWLQPAVEA
jgi:hypothetical protein